MTRMIQFPAIALACMVSGCIFTFVGCGRQEGSITTSVRLATPQEVALVSNGTKFISLDSYKPLQKTSLTPALVYNGRLYFICCRTTMQRCQSAPKLLQNARPPNGYDLQKLLESGNRSVAPSIQETGSQTDRIEATKKTASLPDNSQN